MEDNKLQRWALAAEIVGGLAVVLSLGVVAYELNQSTKQAELNTSALEISAYQTLINSIIDLNSVLITDPDLASIAIKAYTDEDSLSAIESVKLNSYFINVIRHGDMAFFQYERGAIDKERLDSVLAIVAGNLTNPVAIKRFEGAKVGLSDSYVEYLKII